VNSVTALQPLAMYNGEFVNEQSRHFAARVAELTGADRARQVTAAFEWALNRAPSQAEMPKSLEFLSAAGQDGLAGLCRVLFNSIRPSSYTWIKEDAHVLAQRDAFESLERHRRAGAGRSHGRRNERRHGR
jgi:hypothetical protein